MVHYEFIYRKLDGEIESVVIYSLDEIDSIIKTKNVVQKVSLIKYEKELDSGIEIEHWGQDI